MAVTKALSVIKNRAVVAVTAGTPVAGWTPATGKKFVLVKGQLSLSVAGTIILKDATTEILRSPVLAAAGIWDFDLGGGLPSATADNVLNIDVSASGNVGGWVGGEES